MPSENTKYLVRGAASPLEASLTPKPTSIEPTEVMIRLKAIAINPADYKMIDIGHRGISYPLVAGLDGAGIIESVGSNVKNFAPGDEVLALFSAGDRAASFQNFAIVQEAKIAKKPPTWSFEDASTVGVCFMTAVVGLGIGLKTPLPFLKNGPITGFKPSSVLVLGGSSALGAATIQLLRLAIPDCIILTTSSPKNHNHITNLGANGAFDRNSATLIKDVKSATPGSRGVDAIFDAVGAGSTQWHIFEAFDESGPKRYAQVWTGDDEIEVPSGVDSLMFRGRDVTELEGGGNIMLSLQTLLEEGKYKLPLPVRKVGIGLDGLKEGLDLMKKGVSGEKLVVAI